MATKTRKAPETSPKPRTLKDHARRARSTWLGILHGGRFTCSCCPGKEFRGHKALNAHHLARHGSYWAGEKAKKTGRKLGKTFDAARKHARAWREVHGFADQYGKATDKSRARPELRGHLKIRDLRNAHRHGKSHDLLPKREARHERRAKRAEGKGRTERADIHRGRAADARNRHETRWPQRRPVPSGRTRS